jgi:hypothetical protein
MKYFQLDMVMTTDHGAAVKGVELPCLEHFCKNIVQRTIPRQSRTHPYAGPFFEAARYEATSLPSNAGPTKAPMPSAGSPATDSA